MTSATIYDAKAGFSSLVSEVERTRQPVTITRHGKPVARLVPIEADEPDRAGLLAQFRADSRAKGAVPTLDEITEPLPAEAWGDLFAAEPDATYGGKPIPRPRRTRTGGR